MAVMDFRLLIIAVVLEELPLAADLDGAETRKRLFEFREQRFVVFPENAGAGDEIPERFPDQFKIHACSSATNGCDLSGDGIDEAVFR